ncbi:hypothetical protein FRX31_007740 [Thalictrum thalictroides]|uniref:Uncharacterized protein n=1 Tax=Thalictrum thalictroides TaxID=46969 RepID=A0A7J6X018_THATH|nr:hypothetical protein FRX31_007740 [Thalictrum thalictroides]
MKESVDWPPFPFTHSSRTELQKNTRRRKKTKMMLAICQWMSVFDKDLKIKTEKVIMAKELAMKTIKELKTKDTKSLSVKVDMSKNKVKITHVLQNSVEEEEEVTN